MKDLKKNPVVLQELKNAVSQLKMPLNGVDSKLDIAEEEVSLSTCNRNHPQWSTERENVQKINKAPGICKTISSKLNTSATVVPEAVEKELSQKKNIWRNNGSKFDENYKPTGPRTSMNH